ncbi:hypothetical protein OESDEN_02519 [Oesophagostomum dentatum]|uniref:Uncharacterized protein n=1 Tax=Oesophagostomum dentatum TaxID=61180 RepID=A0A0B1TJR6_OESDE|nr:hypothetical protein OESDEN_02519 [Oesophagostomum dentatum]
MARKKIIEKEEEDSADMPLWASRIIERFDMYSATLQQSLHESFHRFFNELDQQNLLYSTMVRVQTDSEKIDEKSKRIAFIGIDEMDTEASTRQFD